MPGYDRAMKGPRLVIGLLILATVLVDAVAVTITHQYDNPQPAVILTWSLQLAQVSLIAIWLALGGQASPWRLFATVAILIAWSYAMASLPDAPEVGMWLLMFAIQTVAVSVPLLVARPMGLRVGRAASVGGADDSSAGPKRLQFSILYLLGWMTALAATLGTLKYVAPFESLPLNWLANWSLLAVLLSNAVVGLAALWTVLGTRRLVLRMTSLVLANLTAFAVVYLRIGYPLDTFWSVPMLYLLDTLWLVGPLLVFRVAGYRLQVRRDR